MKGAETMRALYEIDADIINCVDGETGEILDIERLEALNMERDKKIEGVALYVKQLQAEAEAIKAEEKALEKRRKSKEKLAEGYAKWIANVLAGAAFETAKVALGFRKSTVCEFTGCALGIIEYLEKNGFDDCVKYGAPELNKQKIKQLLNDGKEIPGVVLAERNNLQIK